MFSLVTVICCCCLGMTIVQCDIDDDSSICTVISEVYVPKVMKSFLIMQPNPKVVISAVYFSTVARKSWQISHFSVCRK